MAWLERRGDRFRIAFRFRGGKFGVNLKASDPREAEGCLARLEENLRLVERGRLAVPPGADLGLFLLSDGKLDKPVEVVRAVRLAEMFATYRSEFTAGAKEAITREMEGVHMKHLARLIGGDTPVGAVTAGTVQQFVDARSRETHRGHPVKAKTVRKAVATFRFVWNWTHRRGDVPAKFPDVDLVFPKEKQPEPFRTYDQIQAILARGEVDPRRVRELWDGLFLDPVQVAEVLAHVRRKTSARYLHPFLTTAAYTGARRAELFRARVEDFDFGGRLVLLREKKRSRDGETFRTVDMTPRVEEVMREYFAGVHPGGGFAFCSAADRMLTDGQTWKAFRTGVKGSKWHVLRGYHAFRHSFASNLAAAGVDQRVIDELMGHTTVEMQKRYRHLFPDQRRAAVLSVFGA
ncbi:MAG: site-specific integrase [Gemmataceae bacterium]|nr:site-specific integrase [Gemmataceae bacterium]